MLPLQGVRVWSLVGELTSHRPQGSARNTKTKALEHMTNGFTYFQKLNIVWKRFHLWTQNTAPKTCCGLWWQSSKRDSAVVSATTALESCDLHRWPPQVTLPQGLCPLIMRILGNFCDRGWTSCHMTAYGSQWPPMQSLMIRGSPCPESPQKMLPKLGREGGFLKPSGTETDNLTAESEEAWDSAHFSSLHALALFHKSRAL